MEQVLGEGEEPSIFPKGSFFFFLNPFCLEDHITPFQSFLSASFKMLFGYMFLYVIYHNFMLFGYKYSCIE